MKENKSEIKEMNNEENKNKKEEANKEGIKEQRLEEDNKEVGNKSEAKEKAKEEIKESKDKKTKVKKTEAFVNVRNAPISLKVAVSIGRFIKYKRIDESISLLEKVINKKIAIPFKGEMPHRKGLMLNNKRMMTGKYPIKASKNFIRILRDLSANANVNGLDMDKVIIKEVIINKGQKQYHRFGNTQFKRVHIYIKAAEQGKENVNK
ncbi:MAG: uL22 family ribosomal protein [Candidatus Pacearchaeota archaeon]